VLQLILMESTAFNALRVMDLSKMLPLVLVLHAQLMVLSARLTELQEALKYMHVLVDSTQSHLVPLKLLQVLYAQVLLLLSLVVSGRESMVEELLLPIA
jgi:hypothetical protein